ncbi:MAG: hypothetical protein ACRERD_21385 [Candidatus Binatia bacterium]
MGRVLRGSTLAVLILSAFATSVQGQWIHPRFGGYIKVPTIVTGRVVCTDCTLEQAERANPDMINLYLFKHEGEQAVFQVNQIRNPSEEHRWAAIAFPPRLRVRTSDEAWQQLTAEENLFQEVKLNALLRSTRTLDIFDVRVVG